MARFSFFLRCFFFFFKQKAAYEIRLSLVGSVMCIFFFFKQKTAYEIMPSLVGSEMCIRDSACRAVNPDFLRF